MDFRRAIGIIDRRKWLILVSVLVTALLVYGVTRVIPSRWVATVRLIAPSGSLFNSAVQKVTDGAEPDAGASARIYAAIARSREVMEASARAAHVESQIQKLAESIELEGAGARMFELRYTDTEASRARAMVNSLADNLIAQNRGHNSAEALRTVNILEQQLRNCESELRALQAQYDQYCIDNQMIPGDFLNQVKGVSKLIEVAQTSKAEAAARIAQSRARLEALKNSPEPFTIQDRSLPGSVEEARLTRLIEELDAEIRQLRRRYNDTYPDLKARLDERKTLDRQLNVERIKRQRAASADGAHGNGSRAILDSISADEALIQSQDATISLRQQELDRLKRVNSRIGNLPSLITEKSENRSGIASRLNVAKAALDVAERQNALVVLEYSGETNPPVNTSAGRTLKLVGLGALCAFIVAAGLAIAFESMDRRLKTVQEADQLLPARVVAVIPQSRDETSSLEWARVAELRPLATQSEAYRFLGQLMLSPQNRRHRSLMALSAKSGQGNTRMLTNLAITLAQAGQRVILIDANLRQPMLNKVFNLSNEFGLTEVLKRPAQQQIEKALQFTTVHNLRVITSGTANSNPWELFSSHRLEELSNALRGQADYLLFDTPSALAYTDTLSLSTIIDAALLSVRASDPLAGAEHRLGEMFALSEVQILGSVLMDAPPGLIGSYEREIRAPGRGLFVPVPALEAGEITVADSDQIHGNPVTAHIQAVPDIDCEQVPAPEESASVEKAPQLDVRTAPIVDAGTETGTAECETIQEETEMKSASDTPPGGFPKSIHGYNISAVDDYVRKINSRLESLLSQVQAESSRADQSKRVLEQMTVELDTMRRRASDAEKREMEAIDKQKHSEEEAARLLGEQRDARERARTEMELALADARQERDAIIDEERQDAEALVAEARRLAAAQIAELQQELDGLRALTADSKYRETGYSDLLQTAEAQRIRLEAEVEAQRVYARSQIDLVVTEARRDAEEAGANAAAVYYEQQARVRALGEEYEAIITRMREAMDAQMTQLPSLATRATAGAGMRGGLRSDEPDEKRIRENREWRNGDWRNAS